ncbi:MAG: hypothetical protein NW217_08555 [Hyphomicrobiaceae bacterium]|nr:hypothetical protein [Hyphomicrobiaceae bacterium]
MRLSRPAKVVGLALAGALWGGVAFAADKIAVKVENKSEPVLCAEKDNVTLTLSHAAVTSFRVEAAHPSYIGTIDKDNFAPDWTACDFAAEALGQAGPQEPPKKVSLYEGLDLSVTGFTIPSFWRKRSVPITIDGKTFDDIHLLQVWVRHAERAEEVLVLYPTDGYWRARPLPPEHLGWSAYGSSVLVGPVEDAGRPVVNLAAVAFDPKTRVFDLAFAGGGAAKLTISKLDRERQVLDVTFDKPIGGPPFAALRSMYITKFNNDVAEVAVQEEGAPAWREEPVMSFSGAAKALQLWTGRTAVSRHNTSAPDTVFGGFVGVGTSDAK